MFFNQFNVSLLIKSISFLKENVKTAHKYPKINQSIILVLQAYLKLSSLSALRLFIGPISTISHQNRWMVSLEQL